MGGLAGCVSASSNSHRLGHHLVKKGTGNLLCPNPLYNMAIPDGTPGFVKEVTPHGIWTVEFNNKKTYPHEYLGEAGDFEMSGQSSEFADRRRLTNQALIDRFIRESIRCQES